ncbi:MAG: ECF transporter S component [Clostridia bacterium]|nr:ECF transporter S component [Clostridia bacterium]
MQNTRRLVLDAMLVALYVVFATVFSFETPLFKVSLTSLPILLSACLFGIKDTVAVAFLGSFIDQLLYGLGGTTPLWIAPVVLFAIVASLAFWLVKQNNWLPFFLLAIIFSEFVLTAGNSIAIYIDNYLKGNVTEVATIFTTTRIINWGARTAISCILVPLLLPPLRALVGRTKY